MRPPLENSLDWSPFEQVAPHVPANLRDWLTEPGLLTARIRAACGEQFMRFRMLGPLRPAPLPDDLATRLGVHDPRCLLREIEFCFDDVRLVFAQSVLPDSTLDAFPWLRGLGDSPLGESLQRAPEPLQREPLEFARLGNDTRLALGASDASPDAQQATLWARRAVYRLAGRPILVQEVFLPALLRVGALRAQAGQRAS